MDTEWCEADWRRVLRPVVAFSLDAGFEAPSHVWNWLLPRWSRDEPMVRPPALPVHHGRVLSADAAGREETLARFYAQFPRPPPPEARHDHAWANCFAVDLLLQAPGEDDMIVDMFGPGVGGADAVLTLLADLGAPPSVAYDNLDQGWALQIIIEAETVVWLVWDWEHEGPGRWETALSLPRAAVAAQAAAARVRMNQVHRHLVAAFGLDLWRAGLGEG